MTIRNLLLVLCQRVKRSFTVAELAMALAFLAYTLANNGGFMHFNYHVHLAEAFLQGKLYLLNPPAWLTELAWYQGRPYVYYGPLPSVLLLPLVAIFHESLNLARICTVLGAINVGLVWRLLERLGCSTKTTAWLTAVFAVGSVQFWVSSYGNTWLFAQLCANCFLLTGALEVLGKRRGWLIGLVLGSAVLSREACLLAIPCYLILLNLPRWRFPSSAGFFVGLSAWGLAAAWYNWARFGNPLDNGYLYANQALWHPPHGSFSLHYLITMLPAYFWRGPTFVPHPPFALLTDHGLSLFWTTPVFLLLFPAANAILQGRAVREATAEASKDETVDSGARPTPHRYQPYRDRTVAVAAWSSLLPMAGLYLLYFWDGWRQFGARYSLDYTPFILIILGLYLKNNPTRCFQLLAVAAFLVNLWGIAYWRLSGW
ncbi:MAG: hypothetical protein HY692_01270 [Cyanobacteria bacterium NC_groundwater_1444_Ag_S-0.65um_54_12]|nr:hypothetical protein [Cyanobacteria bacterium NC_groundwater_1444_Ag_S-0.65um_54_12]